MVPGHSAALGGPAGTAAQLAPSGARSSISEQGGEEGQGPGAETSRWWPWWCSVESIRAIERIIMSGRGAAPADARHVRGLIRTGVFLQYDQRTGDSLEYVVAAVRALKGHDDYNRVD